jgi:hypothetical protein
VRRFGPGEWRRIGLDRRAAAMMGSLVVTGGPMAETSTTDGRLPYSATMRHVDVESALGRIRTCAHGSGGRCSIP